MGAVSRLHIFPGKGAVLGPHPTGVMPIPCRSGNDLSVRPTCSTCTRTIGGDLQVGLGGRHSGK